MAAGGHPPWRAPRPHISVILIATGILLLVLYKGALPSAICWNAQAARQQNDLTPPPWQEARDCPIYILDISKDVAPHIGIPQCNIDDPKVWPLAKPGELPWELQRMESMPHPHYMYAGQYWLNQALRNASGVLTDDIDKACLVWVDAYCYNQWYIVWRALERRKHLWKKYPRVKTNVEEVLTRAMDHIVSTERFKKRQGRDYVFYTPFTNPGRGYHGLCTDMLLSHTLVVEHPLSCAGKGRPKVALRESQILPYSAVANLDLAAPVVGSPRPTFLYMQANCGTANCGMAMRLAVAEALRGRDPDVEVNCANKPVVQHKRHADVQAEMRASLFCLLVPGDNVSSGRLTEAILAGCIPVFIGAPWHEMPFNHGEVDWPAISVFIEVQQAPWMNHTECPRAVVDWPQRADVRFATAVVPSLDAAYTYLRQMPKAAVAMRQEALQRERLKLYYGVGPGRRTSALSDIVFSNLLAYGRRVAAGLYT